MRMIRRRRGAAYRHCVSIGFIGCGHGVGVTHTAIACANYLSGACGYRVGYVELMESGGIADYMDSAVVISGRAVGYSYMGVDYYPSADADILSDINRSAYDALICDYGIGSDESCRGLMGCERRLIIGSMQPWRYEEYRAFMRDYYIRYDTLHGDLYGLFLRDGQRRRFMSEFGTSAARLGFIADPYELGRDELALLRDITAGWL